MLQTPRYQHEAVKVLQVCYVCLIKFFGLIFHKNSVFFSIFLSISNSIKYKVTLLVHKQRNKSYIFSVVFVINLN